MNAARRVVTLGEVATIQSGFAFKSSQWVTAGVPVVKIANVKSGRIDLTSNQSFVSESDAEKAARFRLQHGDIVIGMTGYVGEVAQVRSNDHLLLNQRVGLIQIDESKADRQYLFHLMSGEGFRSEAKALAYGSAQPNISPSLLHSIEIELPPIEEQRAIAATLGALDDKIESNRRKIKLTWELASSRWRALLTGGNDAPLGSILQLAYGKALPARVRLPGAVPVYGSSGVTGSHNEALVDGPAVIIGRKGTVGSVHWEGADSFPIDTTFIVEPIYDWPLIACYFAALSAGLSEMNSDSAVPGLNRDRALSVEVRLPELADAQKWAQDIMPLIELATSASREIEVLAQLRDSLTPELLSGRISAVQEFAE